MEQTFWMVYAAGRNAPTKKHPTFLEAENEAIRLAKTNQCSVYVLQAIQGYRPVQVERFDMQAGLVPNNIAEF